MGSATTARCATAALPAPPLPALPHACPLPACPRTAPTPRIPAFPTCHHTTLHHAAPRYALPPTHTHAPAHATAAYHLPHLPLPLPSRVVTACETIQTLWTCPINLHMPAWRVAPRTRAHPHHNIYGGLTLQPRHTFPPGRVNLVVAFCRPPILALTLEDTFALPPERAGGGGKRQEHSPSSPGLG